MKRILQTLITLLLLIAGWPINTFAQWQNVGQAGFSAGAAEYTSIAFNSANEPYVAYKDYGNGYKATVKKFNGTSWVNVGQPGFSASSANYLYTSLAFSSTGEPYVAFRDNSNGNKATVMKFDGTAWVNVGQAGFSAGAAAYTRIKFNSSGVPYVSYVDDFNSNKASVMMFNGTSWVNVGQAAFSTGAVSWMSFAFSNTDEPYVGFWDGTNSGKATVMKFDGTSWVNVGQAGFSAGEARDNSLEFSNSNEPYLAYCDYANSYKASVMKFDGTTWVNVGPLGFTAGAAGFTTLAFYGGVPYMAYSAGANATVMKFDGNSWVYVGQPGFSAGPAQFLSFAFSISGEPYVSYDDGAFSNKASVMKYVSPTGINNMASNSDNIISMHPNPAKDALTITNLSNGSTVIVKNITGKHIYSYTSKTDALKISTADLKNGIYIIQVENQSSITTKKLVLNK